MKNALALLFFILMATALFAQSGSLTTDQDRKVPADLVLYPNPASDMIYIEHTRPVTEIRVFDILGQAVAEFKTAGSRHYVIDISELKKGIYFVRVRDEENNIYSQKVLKQ